MLFPEAELDHNSAPGSLIYHTVVDASPPRGATTTECSKTVEAMDVSIASVTRMVYRNGSATEANYNCSKYHPTENMAFRGDDSY